MATRAIVTSHPDVECDVCGRRLLRGEQPDVFLAGGQRRTVCELCAPRAAHEGWLREAEDHSLSPRAARPQRGRTLLGRLRQLREPAQRGAGESGAGDASTRGGGPGLYDFLDSAALAAEAEPAAEQFIELLEGADTGASSTRARAVRDEHTNGDLKAARALEVFNVGEHPRRVAGVARSLGAPTVLTRPLASSGSLVSILVAWELCWYRYEVDLGDEAAGARLVAQGMELAELEPEDREPANAAADERGELVPLV
ncbi:MAG TPA: hypothetical protein VLJ42_13850 [Solirubrobacteraceae bacterium]|nr:hypothetical protein [Solirubrobacteraceae bacterium]